MSWPASGSGTRDSPIVLDDESEDENMIIYHDDSFIPSDDLLLSPRPGTFLSAISRPHLPVVPAQGTKQQKEGSVFSKVPNHWSHTFA
jgi:hypothetical protein